MKHIKTFEFFKKEGYITVNIAQAMIAQES